MKKNHLLPFILFIATIASACAQSTSISPSRLYFKAAPGDSKKQKVHVTNNSTTPQSYNITFGDFEAPGLDGKTKISTTGPSDHSTSKYMSASPSFFTLEPGKEQDIEVNMDLPNLPEANKVKWGTLMMKIVKERSEVKQGSGNEVGMGIVETFQFVVHIFQTPPSVTFKRAEIQSLELKEDAKSVRRLAIITKNTGEAILDCATYLEFSNLQTGVETRNKPSAFTLLPGAARRVYFPIPDKLPKGKYTVTAIVDFGSKDDVQAAQMDIVIP
jgi:P pilus assembly chaperone PapD